MNNSIFITTTLVSISSCMLLKFMQYLKLKQEQPLQVQFMFGKIIPSEYNLLPYHPTSQKQIMASYILFYGMPLVNLLYNPWWSSILLFVIGKILGTIITRIFIQKRGYWGITSIFSIVMFIQLVIVLLKS